VKHKQFLTAVQVAVQDGVREVPQVLLVNERVKMLLAKVDLVMVDGEGKVDDGEEESWKMLKALNVVGLETAQDQLR